MWVVETPKNGHRIIRNDLYRKRNTRKTINNVYPTIVSALVSVGKQDSREKRKFPIEEGNDTVWTQTENILDKHNSIRSTCELVSHFAVHIHFWIFQPTLNEEKYNDAFTPIPDDCHDDYSCLECQWIIFCKIYKSSSPSCSTWRKKDTWKRMILCSGIYWKKDQKLSNCCWKKIVSIPLQMAIIKASWYGKSNEFRLLFDRDRVDPIAFNNDAIRWASENGHSNVGPSLLDDDRVNLTAVQIDTAIKVARNYGHMNVLQLLLDDGRVNLTTASIDTEIKVARHKRHFEVVALLEPFIQRPNHP